VKVKRPRLRHKSEGEVAVPAYAALQDNGATAGRMMGALLRGVSTRQYEAVLPEMAATVGVSKSSISRQAIEGSAEQLRQLRERRWEDADLLVTRDIFPLSESFAAVRRAFDREGEHANKLARIFNCA